MRNKPPTLASVWKQFVMEKTNNFNSSQVIELYTFKKTLFLSTNNLKLKDSQFDV